MKNSLNSLSGRIFVHKSKNSGSGFNKFTKNSFFLKYMHKKGLIPDPSIKNQKQDEIKKPESINLKELLDERNIQISMSDIVRDYKYFKREYYSIDLNPPPEKPNMPFDRKDITFKKVFHYYFIQVKFLNYKYII